MKQIPSMDQWLREAKVHESAPLCGMYLTHNGTVRQTAKAKVRLGEDAPDVSGMYFTYDQAKVDAANRRVIDFLNGSAEIKEILSAELRHLLASWAGA